LLNKFRILVSMSLALEMSVVVAHAATALKNFYSGSSMASYGPTRTITLQFSEDGTGLYEDNRATSRGTSTGFAMARR
jgi:hypothetical protein